MYFLLLPFFSFLSGHRFLHKAFGTTRKNQRVVNFFFKRLCPLLCEYNCLSFTDWLLRVFFLRCHFDFQIYIRTTYKGYVFLSEKFASLLLNTIIKRTLLFIIPKIIQLFVFVEKFVLDLFNVDQFLKFSVSFSLTKNQYKFGEISF